MEDLLEPGDARSRKFEVVRRGYDKRQVDRFREEAAVSIAALQTELAELKEKLNQAGMADVPDLKSEIDAVGSQISEILDAARAAAEGMRSRASEDAARWRAEADKESRRLRVSSARDAEQARRAAWEEGTRLLEQAEAESKRLVEEAQQEALFIRAEAEREALRLTGNARRDQEEAVRTAKKEADRLLIEARGESDRILEKARQSAQAAQERAQALEQRRRELMQELEAARLSIGQLEKEIDSRRAALHAAAEAPDSGVRVIQTSGEKQQEWADDDGTVRIVPASHVASDEPVDPDAFVEEVERLQSKIAAAVEAEEAAVPDPDTAESEAPAAVEAARAEPADESAPVTAAEVAEPGPDDATDEPGVSGSAEEEKPPPESGSSSGERGPEKTPADPDREETAPEPRSTVPEGIAELFAQLRDEPEPPRPEQPPAPASEAPAAEASPSPPPSPRVETVTLERAEPAGPARSAQAAALAQDPFELRDRLLLPIENRTLRSVKRRIVDLQNRVLEELRVGDDDWEPDHSMFAATVSEDIGRLNQESFVAGHAAAADLLSEAATPPPDRPAGQAMSGDFVAGLRDAVVDALTRSRRAGGGSRQVSAAVGRVFRAWRTDEAERRLRRASHLAYNEGLIGAYPELGVEHVIAVAPGTPCGQCPADRGEPWRPGGRLPAGTMFPPATPECRATIVPAL